MYAEMACPSSVKCSKDMPVACVPMLMAVEAHLVCVMTYLHLLSCFIPMFVCALQGTLSKAEWDAASK